MITENLLTDRPFTWIDVQEPHSEDFDRLNTEFNLPFLLVQDTLKPEHLPKYEEADEGHFLMMRSFDPESDPESTTVQDLTRKIALFITDKGLISIHRVELAFIKKVSEKCKKSDFPKTIQGLIHQLVIEVIRSYEAPINQLQDSHDDFEDQVLSKNCVLDTGKIHRFRRQLFVLKRVLKQTNDALYRFKDFWEEYPSMLQDLRENIDQLYFRLDEISDNFEHLFELQVQINDQRANEIMKTLTIFSTILLPLNFIASFYGMNFSTLPGLDSPNALIFITTVMGIVTFAAILYFKYKGWFKVKK